MMLKEKRGILYSNKFVGFITFNGYASYIIVQFIINYNIIKKQFLKNYKVFFNNEEKSAVLKDFN